MTMTDDGTAGVRALPQAGGGRPQFHFTVGTGWMNDPHGITYRDGAYEVFFQYVPGSTSWEPHCHWGHATGEDLLSLRELPVAITPGDGDGGIWTGCLVTDDAGSSRIFYTSTTAPNLDVGRVRVAYPADEEWIEWRKGDVVAEAPPALDVLAFRDPFVLRDGTLWRMFVGASLRDGSAAALSYVSEDLDAWRYEGIAAERSSAEREQTWMGTLWECPQILEFGTRDALVTSVWDAGSLHHSGYAIGNYADGRFDAETWGQLTYGPSYYAPSFFRDAEGRPCLLFWMRGVDDPAAGWASALSVPHVLAMEGDRLVAAPHPDVERYRGEPVPDHAPLGTAADLVWTPASAAAQLEIGIGGERRVTLSTGAGRLHLHTEAGSWSMPFDGGAVRVLLDGPVVEVSTASALLGAAIPPPEAAYSVLSMDGTGTAWPLHR